MKSRRKLDTFVSASLGPTFDNSPSLHNFSLVSRIVLQRCTRWRCLAIRGNMAVNPESGWVPGRIGAYD